MTHSGGSSTVRYSRTIHGAFLTISTSNDCKCKGLYSYDALYNTTKFWGAQWPLQACQLEMPIANVAGRQAAAATLLRPWPSSTWVPSRRNLCQFPALGWMRRSPWMQCLSGFRAKEAWNWPSKHVWASVPPQSPAKQWCYSCHLSRESPGDTKQGSRATLHTQARSGLTVWALLIFFTSHWPSPVYVSREMAPSELPQASIRP